MPGPDGPVLAFALLACALLGVGVLALLHMRRTDDLLARRTPRTSGQNGPDTHMGNPTAAGANVDAHEQAAARRMCATFREWLSNTRDYSDAWAAFDQLVREMVTEHLGAQHVRCFRGPNARPLSGDANGSPDVRDGILGHVAMTGQEYLAGDNSHGALVDELAAQSEEKWSWIWPIPGAGAALGVVAVGRFAKPTVLASTLRQTVGGLVAVFWQHVACLEECGVQRRTDSATGVLTREDFFAIARGTLTDAYECSEPVVLAAVAIEGLRGLDDAGHWQQRDELITRVGHGLHERVRSDDVVGRFSDERFVVLLRRLDSGLGKLIAEKLLAWVQECVSDLSIPDGGRGRSPTVRVGLRASGAEQPPLEELLSGAMHAVESAREQAASLVIKAERTKAGGITE